MKIISTSRLSKNTYNIEFDDGIVLTLDKSGTDFTVVSQCSLGTDTYFTKRNKFPKGQNLNKRILMGGEMIEKRSNRYKKYEKESEEE